MTSDSNSDLERLELLQNTKKFDKEHADLLEETKKVCDAFIISSTVGFFGESMMLSMWILFAKTLYDCTDESITILVFLQSILQIVGVLCTSWLSDKYGFDIITILTSTILLISILLHSASFSIVTLGIGISLKGLVMDDIEVLSLGFIAKLLPFNMAATYTGYWYAWTTLTYLLGVVCGGILSTYTTLSYRMVFIVSAFIILLRWIYILIKIRNTQNTLIQKQLKFIPHYKQQSKQYEEEENLNNIEMTENQKTWFPLCLEQIENENKNIDQDNFDYKKNTSTWKWFELTLNIIQFGFVSCFINVSVQFASLYMLNRYNLSVFWTSTQIIATVISFGILAGIMPDYIKHLSLLKKYLLAFPFYLILIVMFMFAIPLTTKKVVYLIWIWWLIIGTSLGVLFVVSEICILELQPKAHTGKINGMKTTIRFAVAAIIASLTAYFWNSGEAHVWFCYFQGIVYVIAFVINICLVFLKVLPQHIYK